MQLYEMKIGEERLGVPSRWSFINVFHQLSMFCKLSENSRTF